MVCQRAVCASVLNAERLLQGCGPRSPPITRFSPWDRCIASKQGDPPTGGVREPCAPFAGRIPARDSGKRLPVAGLEVPARKSWLMPGYLLGWLCVPASRHHVSPGYRIGVSSFARDVAVCPHALPHRECPNYKLPPSSTDLGRRPTVGSACRVPAYSSHVGTPSVGRPDT